MTRPLAAALLAAAAAVAPRAAEPAPRTLSVAAAASVKPALDELARAFEASAPGVRIAVTTGASGTFFAQLRSGAPFDVFLSADREYPRKVVEAGLATEDGEAVYAIGRLVVWAPRGSPADVAGKGILALGDPAVRRIAIANPAVAPYGRAAEAALRAAGLLERVRDRLVLGQSVAQAAQFAASGAADAALVPLSVARSPALADGTRAEVPAAGLPSLEQSAVVLRSSRDPALARAFVAFLRGPAGREILARHGYGLP